MDFFYHYNNKLEKYLKLDGVSEREVSCYQKGYLNEVNGMPPFIKCSENQLKELKKTGKIEGYRYKLFEDGIMGLCQKVFKELKFSIPKLKRCEIDEVPGKYYSNCCPSAEYDSYLLRGLLNYKKINKIDFWNSFSKFSPKEKYIMAPVIIEKLKEKIKSEIQKSKKEIKAETQKSVIIPVDKPLTIEQMGLLESTIYSTFVIVKFLLK